MNHYIGQNCTLMPSDSSNCLYSQEQPSLFVGGGISAISSIHIESTQAVNGISPGDTIPIGNISSITGSGISYNSSSNSITVNSSGHYLFIWSVIASPAERTSDIVISLESVNNGTILARSGVKGAVLKKSMLISGSAVAVLPAGGWYAFYNRSADKINVNTAGKSPDIFASGITVVRLG